MNTTIKAETGSVWSCRLFSWSEKGEARGIDAHWSSEPLVIGRYVELKGEISVKNLPLEILIEMEARIKREGKFLNWINMGSRKSEKEDWMETYPGQRLNNYLEFEFAVKEADILHDDLIYSFGNLGRNTDNRLYTLLFLRADDTEKRSIFKSLELHRRYEEGIIAFYVMTDDNRNVNGLEVSTVWRVISGGESVGKPEYFFDVGLQYKYEGGGGTIGEMFEGVVGSQEPTTYRLLGRSQESEAGPIELECHLAFLYWNPVKRSYDSVPEGIEVRVIDYDPISANEVIGRGKTIRDGKIKIVTVNTDEDNPDVFIELLTNRNYIELENNKLVTKNNRQSDKHYQVLPQKWSSKNKYATDYSRGFFDDFEGTIIGNASLPLMFHLTLDCFIQFVYWNEIQQRYIGLPEGIEVEVIDYDPETQIPIIGRLIGTDDPLGRNFTDRDGKVSLRLFYKDEANPDIYFRYRVPDDKPNRIDLATNELSGEPISDQKIEVTSSGPVIDERPIGTKMPRAQNGTLPIPREWSTRQRYVLEDPTRKGYWNDYKGYCIGRPENPYIFDIFQEMPRWIRGNSVEYLINGDKALPKIIDALENAEHSIHIEVMLFYNDEIGKMIKDLLIRKAKQDKVEVRLLFDVDTTASSYSLIVLKKIWVSQLIRMEDAKRRRLLDEFNLDIEAERNRGNTKEMRRELEATRNIKFRDSSFPYVQLMPSAASAIPSSYQDIEGRLPFFTLARIDHRKLIIIDGKIGFLGGMNIGQEYLYNHPFDLSLSVEEEVGISSTEKWAKWHDCYCEIRGPSVRELQKLFRERWITEGGDEFAIGPRSMGVGTDPNHPFFPMIELKSDDIPVKIVSTTPGARFHIHEELIQLIDNAQEEINIENPYLSSLELKEHLITAADKRDVKINYVFPDEHNDSIDFLYSARIKYKDFLQAGVNIYEYKNHMTHAKVATVDNDITIIGSANLNHSSMFNHYECNVFIKSESITRNFKRDLFEIDITNSRSISEADLDELIQIYPAAYLYLWSIVNVWF